MLEIMTKIRCDCKFECGENIQNAKTKIPSQSTWLEIYINVFIKHISEF